MGIILPMTTTEDMSAKNKINFFKASEQSPNNSGTKNIIDQILVTPNQGSLLLLLR